MFWMSQRYGWLNILDGWIWMAWFACVESLDGCSG